MWVACRPYLPRPRALGVLSQLPLPRVVGGGASRGRKLSDASGGDHKKHLYLVLDALDKGCSVHKLDIDAAANADAGTHRGRLPGPPVTRLHYPTRLLPDLLLRWRWNDVPYWLPFRPEHIMGHALHPGRRAFFASLHCPGIYAGHRDWGTFSYDTGRGRGEWTRHGDWELPFAGQAHYDAELGAWVGLHLDLHDRDDDFYMDGHICCCDVPPLAGCGGDTLAPDWKLGKEELFVVDPERHIDAKLVPMDGGGKFCLVEILAREGVGREECLGDGDKCVLRLTTFRVKYGDDGELTVRSRRPLGEYMVSRYVDMFQVQVFWT